MEPPPRATKCGHAVLHSRENDHELFVDRAHIVFDGEFIHPAEIGHRGIVVEDVNAAVALEREADERVAYGLLGQVGRMQRHHLPARAFGVAKRDLGLLRVEVAAHDLGALGAEQQRRRTAHAVAGSRDDADLVLEALRHGFLPGDDCAQVISKIPRLWKYDCQLPTK
jgi:hypothetical protein